MKALGAALVLTSAAGVFLPEMLRRRREEDTLRCLAAVLGRMEAEIRGRRTPLPRLLETLSREEPSLGPGLGSVLAGLRAGAPLPELLRRCGEGWGLSLWCRTALEELGGALGGDAGESTGALTFARQRVLEELAEKRQGREEREKRVAALCFSGAALIIILLL